MAVTKEMFLCAISLRQSAEKQPAAVEIDDFAELVGELAGEFTGADLVTGYEKIKAEISRRE